MKRFILAAIYSFFVFFSITFGQGLKNIQEPEYIGIFYSVNLNDGTIAQLDKQTWTIRSKQKIKLFGLGGIESEAEAVVNGEKSPIRFAFDQQLAFAVRVESNLIDPSTIIGFSLVEIKEGKRVFLSKKIKTSLINGKLTDSQGKAISVKLQKYGKSSFLFYPIEPLSPGEYVLTNPQTPYVFCFGVDPISSKPNTNLTPFVGRYNRQDKKSDYFELKVDGTLFLQQGGKAYTGRYDVKDSVITFFITDITSKGEILEDTITDSNKGKWIKQKP